MASKNKIITYRPDGSDRSFEFEVPSNATPEEIHSIANQMMLNDLSLISPKTENFDSQQKVSTNERPSVLNEATNAALNLGEGVLNTLGTGFHVIDRANPIGAPLRAAGKALAEGKSGEDALSAYGKEFAFTNPEDLLEPSTTGKELASAISGGSDASLSDALPGLYNDTGKGWQLKKGGFFDPTATGAAGLGIEMLTDPLVGGGKKIPGISALGKGISKAIAPNAAGEFLTGIPSKLTRIYQERPGALIDAAKITKNKAIQEALEKNVPSVFAGTDPIEELAKKYGAGTGESSIAQAVSGAKEAFSDTLYRTRRGLNKIIGMSIQKNNVGSLMAENKPILDTLYKHLDRLTDPVTGQVVNKQAEKEILEMIADVEGASQQVVMRVPGNANHVAGGMVQIKRPPGLQPSTQQIVMKPTGPYGGSSYPRYSGQQTTNNAFIGNMVQGSTGSTSFRRNGPKISLLNTHRLKSKFQQMGSDAYRKQGAIFNPTKESQLAAIDAARTARIIEYNLLDTVNDPRIKNANKALQMLHNIDERQGVNSLLDMNKPPGDLLAAGSGTNKFKQETIRQLDKFYRKNLGRSPFRRPLELPESLQDFKSIEPGSFKLEKVVKDANGDYVFKKTGAPVTNDFTNTAENLAAYNTFSNPPFLPVDATGKAVARQNAASQILKAGGAMIGGAKVAGPIGGMAGLALNSPMALKAWANSYRAAKRFPITSVAAIRGGSMDDRTKSHERWLKKLMSRVQNTPYQQQFSEAAQKGEQSVNAQFFKSYLSDPEFQRMYKDNLYVDNDNSNEINDLLEQEELMND